MARFSFHIFLRSLHCSCGRSPSLLNSVMQPLGTVGVAKDKVWFDGVSKEEIQRTSSHSLAVNASNTDLTKYVAMDCEM